MEELKENCIYLFKESWNDVKNQKNLNNFVYLLETKEYNYQCFVPIDKGTKGVFDSFVYDYKIRRIKTLELEIMNGDPETNGIPKKSGWNSKRNEHYDSHMGWKLIKNGRTKFSEKEFREFVSMFEEYKKGYIEYCKKRAEKIAKERIDAGEEES